MQLSLFAPSGESEVHNLEREQQLQRRWEELFDSFASKEEVWQAWDEYSAEYSKRKADWTGFSEYQAVRTSSGKTGVITILGYESCGLIEVDLKQRLLLGDINYENTPDRLTSLEVDPDIAKELKTLVQKIHGRASAVKRLPDLLAQHLPSWQLGEAEAKRWRKSR